MTPDALPGAVSRDTDDRLSEGLWHVLARWLLVPRTAPDLPHAPGESSLERLRPAPGWLRYGRIVRVGVGAILAVVTAAVGVAVLFEEPVAGILILLVGVPVIVVGFLVSWISLHLAYASTWYVFSSRSMRLRRGMLVIQEETITFENVQDVAVSQGPIQRAFGISDLVVNTAGGGAAEAGGGTMHRGVIAGVADAAVLRERIMDRVRASRGAGLGDDGDLDAAPGGRALPAAAFGSAHVAVLREIRDALRRRRSA